MIDDAIEIGAPTLTQDLASQESPPFGGGQAGLFEPRVQVGDGDQVAFVPERHRGLVDSAFVGGRRVGLGAARAGQSFSEPALEGRPIAADLRTDRCVQSQVLGVRD